MKSKKKPPKKLLGRPTLYDSIEHPKLARKLVGEGKTLNDVAQLFMLSRFTIDHWRHSHPDFSVAIEQGKEDAVDMVERSLTERARGYERSEEKLLVVDGAVENHRHVVHYPADIAAAKFFLVNKRKVWKERSAVEVTGLDGLVAKLASARKRVDTKED